MDARQLKSNPEAAQKTGVINPYALAEYLSGRKINWQQVENIPELLENILQTPYQELFDPKHEGPLYTGLKLTSKGTLDRFHSPIFSAKVEMAKDDLDIPIEHLDKVQMLGDLGSRFQVEDVAKIQVQRAELCNPNLITLHIRLPEKDRIQTLARVFTPEMARSIALDPELGTSNQDWTPTNASWQDKGRFFNEATEFFDPVQGAVANCYFIAALSAVAWSKPYDIANMTRSKGVGQQQFTNMVQFYKPDSNGQVDKQIEVTDTVPVNNVSGNFIYCRSSEDGELWPALYEKAFAKLVTGTSTDHPQITATAYGDPVHATALLTGKHCHYYGNTSLSADQIWDLVRSNSLSRSTMNPMTCWTYGTAPDGLSYSDANIVGNHAYTVLGWDYYCGKKYLVLRNPWGVKDATVHTHGGTLYMRDVDWWRPILLTKPDGVFAIEAATFKQYFAGFGVVK
ncbi:C2 family cysteine protease [Gallaecimonas kandeliae]|uniref:C2 family cysteine protease n=1 Tax=Gallaecimonas kandeliae TaxID=3029055 RepID=UPI002649E05B|nr:C2 family cysteine protease [Gallaecimonas kandeliae]WKE66323.1 C2 family cysteine protease [Gallaecimonas kandeliae]